MCDAGRQRSVGRGTDRDSNDEAMLVSGTLTRADAGVHRPDAAAAEEPEPWLIRIRHQRSEAKSSPLPEPLTGTQLQRRQSGSLSGIKAWFLDSVARLNQRDEQKEREKKAFDLRSEVVFLRLPAGSSASDAAKHPASGAVEVGPETRGGVTGVATQISGELGTEKMMEEEVDQHLRLGPEILGLQVSEDGIEMVGDGMMMEPDAVVQSSERKAALRASVARIRALVAETKPEHETEALAGPETEREQERVSAAQVQESGREGGVERAKPRQRRPRVVV
eukprot:1558906-Rhodomonas_salina.2